MDRRPQHFRQAIEQRVARGLPTAGCVWDSASGIWAMRPASRLSPIGAPTEFRKGLGQVEMRTLGAQVRLGSYDDEEDDDEAAPTKICGYACVWGAISQDLGGFVETFELGAFTIGGDVDVVGRYNHDELLGRTSSGTLRLRQDRVGLYYEIDIPDTQVGRDLAYSIGRGDVAGSSFCFSITDADGEEWGRMGDMPLRTVKRANLIDVSPVDQPAYTSTNGKLALRTSAKVRNSIAAAKLRLAEAEYGGTVTPAGRRQLNAARLRVAEAMNSRP